MSLAKEGIVLDRDDHVISDGTAGGLPPNVRVFRGGWGLAALLGIGIPLFLVAGLVIVGVVLALLLVLWVIRALFGSRRG